MKQAIIVLGLIVAAIGGWSLWNHLKAPEIPDGLAYGNGRIEAVEVDISTKIAGRVEAVLVSEGELVESGQTVAKIETNELRARLLRADAAVASARSEVAAAQAAIAQAKAQQLLAQQAFDRASALVKKGSVSKENYDTSVSQLAVTRANLEAAEATLVSRQRSVDAEQAGADEIQTQIDDATLVSPTMGRVLYRLAEPGEVLGSGGKVMTLLNLADVYIEIFLPAAQAHRVAIGAEARVQLDVLDFAIPGAVSFVSPQAQFTPKQVETESEREKLMFRVKVRVPQQLVVAHIDRVKTGVRGVAYVRLTAMPGETLPPWPSFLKPLPPDLELPPDSIN